MLNTITISLNIQRDKFVYGFHLETTILASFPSKSFNNNATDLLLQKLSTLTIAKFTNCTKIDNTLQTCVRKLRAITIWREVTPDSGLTIALLISLGTCIVRLQSVRVNFAWTKRRFNLSVAAIIVVRIALLRARCASFLLKIKQIPFFAVWAGGLHFWRETVINWSCYWRCMCCFNREKYESLDRNVRIPRSI